MRHRMRDLFYERRLLQRMVPDLQKLLQAPDEAAAPDFDADEAAPGGLWDPSRSEVVGGVNFSDVEEESPDDRDDS